MIWLEPKPGKAEDILAIIYSAGTSLASGFHNTYCSCFRSYLFAALLPSPFRTFSPHLPVTPNRTLRIFLPTQSDCLGSKSRAGVVQMEWSASKGNWKKLHTVMGNRLNLYFRTGHIYNIYSYKHCILCLWVTAVLTSTAQLHKKMSYLYLVQCP